MRKILISAVVMSAMATSALAQNSATESTNSTTKIIQPISLAKDNDLRFGTIVKPSTGSSVISIDEATGARAVDSGNAALVGTGSGRAEFTVTGEGAQTFSITVPATVDMTPALGGDPIAVTLVSSAASGTLGGTLGSEGTANFGVGGSFTVTDATATGNYSGSFDVTVAYN